MDGGFKSRQPPSRAAGQSLPFTVSLCEIQQFHWSLYDLENSAQGLVMCFSIPVSNYKIFRKNFTYLLIANK